MKEEVSKSRLQDFLDGNLWPMIIIVILISTVAMNMAVLTIAVRNPPDLTAEDYYERGANLKEVNDVKQSTLRTGWTVKLDVPPIDRHLLLVNVIDEVGTACDSIEGTCALYRPSDKRLDQQEAALLPIGNGQYALKTAQPLLRGAWECVADLKKGQKHYRDRIAFFVE